MDELAVAGGVVEVRLAGKRRWELRSATLEYTRRRAATLRDGDTEWELRRAGALRRRMTVVDAAGRTVATYAETGWLHARGALVVGDRPLQVEVRRGAVQVGEALRGLLTVAPSPLGGSAARVRADHAVAGTLEPIVVLLLAFVGRCLLAEGPSVRITSGGRSPLGSDMGTYSGQGF